MAIKTSNLAKFSIILTLLIAIFANYVSSWFSFIGGIMLGGALRDLSMIFLIVLSFYYALKTKNNNFFLITILFICFGLYSSTLLLFGDSFLASFLGFRNLLLYVFSGFYLYILHYIGVFSKQNILNYLIFLALILSILGILETITNGYVLEILGHRKDFAGYDEFQLVAGYLGYTRATAGVSDALNYGYLMVLLVFGILFNFEFKKNKLYAYLVLVVIILSSIAVFLTITRGAILLLILGYIFYFLNNKLNLKKLSVMLFFLIIGLFGLLQSEYGGLVLQKFSGNEKHAVNSSNTRINMALDSISAVYDTPLGVGLGSQGAGLKFSNTDNRINTDNYFFFLMLEVGVIGFIIVLIFHFLLFSKLIFENYAYFLLAFFFLCGLLGSALSSPIVSFVFALLVVMQTRSEKEGL